MMRKFLSPFAAIAALALSLSPAAHAESGWGQLNMTPGVTAMSRQIYGLHMLMFWLCVGDRGGRLRRDDLFDLCTSANPGARFPIPPWSTTPRWRSSGPSCRAHPGRNGGPVGPRHVLIETDDAQLAADHQGHRLPVGLAVRLSRQGGELLLQAGSRRAWPRASSIPASSCTACRTTCLTSIIRSSCRSAPRCAS